MGDYNLNLRLPAARPSWDVVPKVRGAIALGYELQKYLHVLGPQPKRSLETFIDLGLSDAEIAQYFKMDEQHITDLREVWNL